MKLYSALLAIGVAQTAAFVAPGAKVSESKLFSSIPGPGGVGLREPGTNFSVRGADNAGQMVPGRGPIPSRTPFDTPNSITVQGGSLRTFSTPVAERIQVLLKTEGRPLNANVELWHGPDNTPQKMNIYIEDGNARPFSALIETPRGQNAIAIRNTAQMEFPLTAAVIDDVEAVSPGLTQILQKPPSEMQVIQGGALRTFSFAPAVSSIAVLLRTDGRPLNARIELLQGPNNNKQVVEVYTEDGMERPFFIVLETPGSGNVVRVVNTATIEFPMNASVEPYMVEDGYGDGSSRGWDNGGPGNFPSRVGQW